VVDVGSGSGILALFAAQAGAGRVFAVEIDHQLAGALRETVDANGFGDKIVVVEGDIAEVPLPQADVVIAEIIETGLLDEQQVPAMNHLWAGGVITTGTRIVPGRYTTTLQMVYASHEYYGFHIVAPKHEWPFYEEGQGWHPTKVTPVSEVHVAAEVDFTLGPVNPVVTGTVSFRVDPSRPINAVRLAGVIGLVAGTSLGPTHAVNGDKIIPMPLLAEASDVSLDYAYEMGAGLAGLNLTWRKSRVHAPAL
jgi:predicted RNA methylase